MTMLSRPGLFLGLLALVTALSLPMWDALSAYYMVVVIWVVNGGLGLLGQVARLPVTLAQDGVYPGLAGAVALFLVTPQRSVSWKLKWIGTLLAVMFLAHAAILLAQVVHAVSGAEAASSMPLRLVGTWGTSVIVIWMWFAAVRRKCDRG